MFLVLLCRHNTGSSVLEALMIQKSVASVDLKIIRYEDRNENE